MINRNKLFLLIKDVFNCLYADEKNRYIVYQSKDVKKMPFYTSMAFNAYYYDIYQIIDCASIDDKKVVLSDSVLKYEEKDLGYMRSEKVYHESDMVSLDDVKRMFSSFVIDYPEMIKLYKIIESTLNTDEGKLDVSLVKAEMKEFYEKYKQIDNFSGRQKKRN